MKVFVCVNCGKVGISHQRGGKDKKFCSVECKDMYYNWKNGHGEGTCLYNQEVVCSVHRCDRCGWNPEVEKKRKEALGV